MSITQWVRSTRTSAALNSAARLAFVTGLLLACREASAPPRPPIRVGSVTVTSPATSLTVGEQVTLEAVVKSTEGDVLQREVAWSSEDESIATVTEGVVTGVAEGAVRIFAASENQRGGVRLVVNAVVPPPPPPPPPVSEVRLSVDDEVQLAWNGTFQLSAKAYDAQGNEITGHAVRWTTSKVDVVRVSETGLLTAVTPGTAMVGAIIDGMSAVVGVRVGPAPIVGITIEAPTTTIELGEQAFFVARLRNAAGQYLIGSAAWSSSAPSVATATASDLSLGAIDAKALGSATITATAEGVSASVTIRVAPRPTHDLLYTRWGASLHAEIYWLSLFGGPTVPVRINAGDVSREASPSPDGTQLVFAVSQKDAMGNPQHDLYIVNRDGMNMRWLTRAPGMEEQPAWSPDGTRIAFRASDEFGVNSDLWTIRPDGSDLTNVTAQIEGFNDKRYPTWSPDGSRIAFEGVRDGKHKIWAIGADGSNLVQITTGADFDASPTWAPSGDRIAFARYNAAEPAYGWDVMVQTIGGGEPLRIVLAGDQYLPAWSPDGEYIAVTGNLIAGQGSLELFTLHADGTGLRMRTTDPMWGGGTRPAWMKR
jgi:uncharacterized protein YjdB